MTCSTPRRVAPRTELQSLEGRRLLAVDLAGIIPFFSIPGTSAGTVAKGTASVMISNKSASAIPNSAKKINVTVALRPAGTTGSADILVGTATNVSVAGLAKGAEPKSLSVKVTIPKSVKAGKFSVVAVIDSAKVIAESNEKNNTVVARDKYSVTAPTTGGGGGAGADLVVDKATASLDADGTGGKYSVTVKNVGTATSAPYHYAVVAKAAGRPEQILDESEFFFPTIPAGKTSTFKDFSLGTIQNHTPNQTTYTVEFRITAGDKKTTNNVKKLGTVTLPGREKFPAPTGANNPLIDRGMGTALSFTSTSREQSGSGAFLSFEEEGTVTDGQGHTGTYEFWKSSFTPAQLRLDFFDSTGFYNTFLIDFGYDFEADIPFTTINGRTFTFSTTTNAGAVAAVNSGGGANIFLIG